MEKLYKSLYMRTFFECFVKRIDFNVAMWIAYFSLFN